jgi:acetone carboxylase gamma subunit
MAEWNEIYPRDMPKGQAFVAISDGACTHCAAGEDIEALIADYASVYDFNSPGEVRCVASLYPADRDIEDPPAGGRLFTIDSEDGLQI